jgi:Na+-transporting NADH:ubiquinone oxidoreductase subunit A
MSKTIQVKKGLNIKLAGEAEKIFSSMPLAESFAIQPSDFIGVTPQLLVKQGEEVKAGTPLFSDKKNELVKFCSPVSGEVIEVVRGEKRSILEIRILPDKKIDYLPFEAADPETLSSDQIILALLKSGAWPFIRQRPFGTIADPKDKPKSIFISAFDTNPLAPDNNFIIEGNGHDFQTGLNALRKLTDGKVHLNVHADLQTSEVFTKARGVQINTISGPHPAGNVGVQIHHIDPVNKGEVVWCVAPQDVLIIGRLFNHGKFDASRVVAVTGSQVKNPKYYKTILGGAVKGLIEDGGVKEGRNRIISGNVLTGKKISSEGYPGFYSTQITVIPEGNEPEFMGWITPGFNKLSMSRTFFSWLTPNRKFNPDTNLHGEERPFVVTGQYEEVFPMDIYPVQLLKSILIEDIELMENLGIYEVVEEDFALCEFVCTSKIESQRIIRKGLDLIRKEFA